MSEKIILTIPAVPKYVSTVRLAVSSVASQAGLDVEAIEDVRLAVSEACNNIIQHAGIEDDSYQVECDLSSDRLDITVRDKGEGYDADLESAGASGEPANNARSGEDGLGLGILIIRTLMDEVKVESIPGQGTTLRMTRYISAG